MIKKFDEFINEDFTDLYKRWKNKDLRKEDGKIITTKYGKMISKSPFDFEKTTQYLLNGDDDFGYHAISVYDINNLFGVRWDFKKDVMNGDVENSFFLYKLYNEEICIDFPKYQIAKDECEEYCDEDDYIEICKLLVNYMTSKKIKIYGYDDYVYVLLDVIPVSKKYEDTDELKKLFNDNFDESIHIWELDGHIYFGVDLNVTTFDNAKKISKFVKDYNKKRVI